MRSCQLCTKPTPAATCPDCIAFVNAQLTQAVFLLPQLTLEAGKQTSKTPGGYTTGSEGRPLGVNLGAISISRRLTAAIGDLAARCGIATTDPTVTREHTYKLAWVQENDPTYELAGELTNAVNSATRLIDLAPQIKTHGKCPTCQAWIKAPADREVHFCTACGTELDLSQVRETLRDIVMDALGGAWFTEKEMPWAMELCNIMVTGKDVRNWHGRDKLPAGRTKSKDGVWQYLFDDVLDVAEQRDIARAKKLLDNKEHLSQNI